MKKNNVIKCRICGKKEDTERWIKSAGDEMRKEKLCFTCNYWNGHAKEAASLKSVRAKGIHYWIGNEGSNESMRGFSGRRFKIKFKDGRVVETTNLWYQGEIPEHFKKHLPDNAEFVNE
jgi:hypothetical protein